MRFKQYDSRDAVQFLTADGKSIKVGGLLIRHGNYMIGMDSARVGMVDTEPLRVLSLTAVHSDNLHYFGVEGVRKNGRHPDDRAGKWFAAVHLARTLRDEEGCVKSLAYSACDSFIHYRDRPYLLLDFFNQVEEGSGDFPIAGRDYSPSEYERLTALYAKVNQEFEGYSNRPTACLALALLNSSEHRLCLLNNLTKQGKLTEAKLRQLSSRNRWELEYVPAEAYLTDPFPPHRPYLQQVNYAEIAAEVTQMRRECRL